MTSTEEQLTIVRFLTGESVAVQKRGGSRINKIEATILSVENIRFAVNEHGEVLEVRFPHDLESNLHPQHIRLLEHLFGGGFVDEVLANLGGGWELNITSKSWADTASQREEFLLRLRELIVEEKRQPKLGELLSSITA